MLAPPPQPKAHALQVVPRAYDLANGHYIFIESHRHTLCAVIGWGLHTTAQRLTSGNIQNTAK